VNHRTLYAVAALTFTLAGCGPQEAGQEAPAGEAVAAADSFVLPGESRLRNVRQLTFGGDNAEAYYAFDGTKLIFQHRMTTEECDQIYVLDIATTERTLVSTGRGRTTCSYFYPSGQEIIYASTHHHDPACPPPPDMSLGYVWPINDTYDIFVANADGTNLRQLTDVMGYDAEATVSPTGDRIVFTSVRDGDLELYSMKLDGSDVKRLTHKLGYDGGAFFSPDGTKIVWRAHYPAEGPEREDYQRLLAEGLIRPGELEIWVANANGSDARQVTSLGGANFAPYWHPSGQKIIWSSNHLDPRGREFDLFMINLDGSGLERVTFSEGFDGFPVFSPDGRYLVFGSNRNNGGTRDTNVFIAEWVEQPGT
jgi:TolB protein